MNQPIQQFVSYVPVPCVCDGIIVSKVEGSPTYDVSIDRTQLGAFQGVVRATPIYHKPMTAPDYNDGERVKILAVFMFDVNNNKFDSVATNFQTQILGKYDPEVLIDSDLQNPITEKADDRVVTMNPKSGSGIVMTDNHELTMTPGGSISHTLKAFGAGVYKNSSHMRCQNYHRIISHNDPAYASREHFGMYLGKDLADESLKVAPTDSLINYRRFVQQTRDPSKWVSICEGAYAPWVGANMSDEEIDLGKDVLFTRIVNNEAARFTQEYGEPGDEFLLARVDEVKVGEFSAPTTSGATPGVLGNKFKFSVSDSGEVEVHAVGKGVPSVNFAGFKMTITEEGLKVQSAKKITFTHGDADESINSIVMDPTAGIDVTALAGFRVNGKKLVNENFVTFFQTFGATGIATSVLPPGSPEPVFPAFIASMVAQSNAPDATPYGFLTASVPIPALGVIAQPDVFPTT